MGRDRWFVFAIRLLCVISAMYGIYIIYLGLAQLVAGGLPIGMGLLVIGICIVAVMVLALLEVRGE